MHKMVFEQEFSHDILKCVQTLINDSFFYRFVQLR